MGEKSPRMLRMDDETHGTSKKFANEFRVDMGTMIGALVDKAREQKIKVFTSPAFLIQDDKTELIRQALSCVVSSIEVADASEKRVYLKMARDLIERADEE